jgi:hypothetical protein
MSLVAPAENACVRNVSYKNCIIADIQAHPQTSGNFSITVRLYSGDNTNYGINVRGAYGASWSAGEWTPELGEGGCGVSIEQTREVLCMEDAVERPLNWCFIGSKPETSRTVTDDSGCTFNWVTQPTGACTGGTGAWQEGEWAPTLGCGPTQQHRSVACSFTANSGTGPVTATCQRSDGAPADESACDPGTRPGPTGSCTPNDVAVCGPEPATTRTTTLTNDCPTGCIPDPANQKYCVKMPF